VTAVLYCCHKPAIAAGYILIQLPARQTADEKVRVNACETFVLLFF
jgi:hypothetical protein